MIKKVIVMFGINMTRDEEEGQKKCLKQVGLSRATLEFRVSEILTRHVLT